MCDLARVALFCPTRDCQRVRLVAQAEWEYKLAGYEPEDYPPLVLYVPPCEHQPLLPGAAEDGMRLPACGLLPASLAQLAAVDSMPQGILPGDAQLGGTMRDTSTQGDVEAPAAGLPPHPAGLGGLLQPRAEDAPGWRQRRTSPVLHSAAALLALLPDLPAAV